MNGRTCGSMRALWALAVLGSASGSPAQDSDPAASAYLEVLERYADGQEEEALRRLMWLERHLVGRQDDVERARATQLGLVEQLRPSDARVLPPIIALHERAYLAYRAEGAAAYALHARTTMLLLCELLADRVLTTAERRLAGDLFASLGGYSQETSSGPIAMVLFERALALDPTNEAALLGAAIDLERRGRFFKALPLLERLYLRHPTSLEGRLRLAVNLGRAGRSGQAMGVLEGLLEEEAPHWILCLAHQAMARLLLDTNSPHRARSVLADGVARCPEDPTLAVALAYVTERLAGGRRELEPLSGLAPSALPLERPPRFVYARHPAQVFARLRTRLRRDARASRGVLAEALAESLSAARAAP